MICLKATRNGPTYRTSGSLGGAPAVIPIEPSPVDALIETSASRATRSSASWNGRSRMSRSNAGLVTSAPSCSRRSVIALPVCFWSWLMASLSRIPLAWIVTLLAPVFISPSACSRAARTRSSRSLRSLLATPAGSGKSGKTRAPSLINRDWASSRASGLGSSSRSTSCSTRSRSAASAVWACPRAGIAVAQASSPRTAIKNPSKPLLTRRDFVMARHPR